MAAELQHLIDKIQSEGVEKAEQEANEILSQAKQKAAQIVEEAEKQAEQRLAQAEIDAQVFTDRSTRTLEQSARDLLITVGQGVENILADLVSDAVNESMNIEVLEKMMVSMAKASASSGGESRIELLISETDQKELIQFFADRYRQKMIHGLEIHTDNEILKGFKVSFADDRVYQDFTAEAIAEALTNFLRPHLAEIVSRVASDKTASKSEETEQA